MTSQPHAAAPTVAWVSAAAAAALLTTHFAMTALHVTPLNPVKVEHEALVAAWTEPLFDQNWKLFAPDPIAVDQGVLVRARYADGRVGEFADIVTPYLKDKHHNLLPSRAGYQVSGVLSRFLEARESGLKVLADKTAADSAPLFLGDDMVRALPESDRYRYTQSLADLRDTARAHVGGVGGAADARGSARIEAVQLRIVQHEFPRFSQRHQKGPGPITHGTSEWLTAGATE